MPRNIKTTTFYLFLLRGIRLLLSIVALIFSAKYFGVSIQRDVWILVITFLTTLGAAIWGALNETFRAKFIFIREEEGEHVALSKTSSLFAFVIIVTISVSLLIVFFAENIADLTMKNMSEDEISLFVNMLLIILPTFLINQLISFAVSILNAYNIFYIPEIVGTITGFLNLLIIILLAPIIGIYSLAISLYTSIIILFITIVWFICKRRIALSVSWRFKFDYIKPFLFFALPFYFPYFVGQLNQFLEKWIAGRLGEGFISSLDYARQFTTVLQSVLTSVLATLMVPLLAKSFSQNDKINYTFILRENTMICFLIMCFVLSFLFGAASPLCEFFFLRGDVSFDTLERIINLVRSYAIAFVGVMMYVIWGMALLSSKKGKQYAFYGVLTQFFVLIINVLFYKQLSVYVFPFSVGFSHFIFSLLLFSLVEVERKKQFCFHISKYIFFTTICSAIIYLINTYIFFDVGNAHIRLLYNILLLILLSPCIIKAFGLSPVSIIKKVIKRYC